MSMETLKQVRKKTGLTQIQAAELCGVSRRTYQTYEEIDTQKDKSNELLELLKKAGLNENGFPAILSVRFIKKVASEIFAKFPEVECAYLFGSYARGEATHESDIDFVIVAPEIGGFELGGLHYELRTALHKDVDLVMYETLLESKKMLCDLLIQGVKIYGQRINFSKY